MNRHISGQPNNRLLIYTGVPQLTCQAFLSLIWHLVAELFCRLSHHHPRVLSSS